MRGAEYSSEDMNSDSGGLHFDPLEESGNSGSVGVIIGMVYR